MKRYLYDSILADLKNKMVFITGPRQVGKTYLAKQIMQAFTSPQYLNFDVIEDRQIILSQSWSQDSDLLIFDEIHKMKNWKAFLKGVYDNREINQAILVTGSARMATFRQSGESLAGRYFHFRLYPVSVKEAIDEYDSKDALKRLNKLGGFPEPFLQNESDPAVYAQRWRNQYYTDLIREDILEFNRITEINSIKHLLELLRTKVGSPVSYKSLSMDLQVAPNTVKKYIQILESLYIIFLIQPWHKNIARSLVKEPKLYFFDSGLVKGDEGIVFENTIAVSLLKHCHFLHDYKGRNISLHYIKTKEKKEVDFTLVENEKPELIIECKLADSNLSPVLFYFKNKYPEIDVIQLVMNLKQEKSEQNIKVFNAAKWLSRLEA